MHPWDRSLKIIWFLAKGNTFVCGNVTESWKTGVSTAKLIIPCMGICKLLMHILFSSACSHFSKDLTHMRWCGHLASLIYNRWHHVLCRERSPDLSHSVHERSFRSHISAQMRCSWVADEPTSVIMRHFIEERWIWSPWSACLPGLHTSSHETLVAP